MDMVDAPQPKLRWYQHSARSPLLFLLLLSVSWFVLEMVVAGEQKAVVEEIENLGGVVWYDYQFDASGAEIPGAVPPADPWLRWLLGDDLFTNVTKLYVRQFTDSQIARLKGLSRLQWLDLTETAVTDAGLEHLKGLTQLHTLNLRATRVTDAGLEHLKGLTKLQSLDVRSTQVTGAGVESLRKVLPNCSMDR